jgi:leucyl aminopeptidase (aminopeptidase T)
MIRVASVRPFVTLCAVLAVLPGRATAQGYPTVDTGVVITRSSAETVRRFQALAPHLVQQAQIKTGDLVSISGGPTLVPEMEVLAVEVQKAGGFPMLFLDSPHLTRALYAEAPDEAFKKIPTAYERFAAQNVAVAFVLPNGEDFASLRQVDRRATVDEAFAKAGSATQAERNKGMTRTLLIGLPTPSDTASIQMDYAAYEKMSWDAIEADYSAMAAKGQEIKRTLESAKRLHITSPEGTDFTVELGKRPVIVNAGLVAPGTKGTTAARTAGLPGGTVRFAPMESSANGKIRAAEDQCTKAIRDESVDVRNGMPENISAASDEQCLKDSFKNAGRFGSVVIGLNSGIHYDHIPSYGPQLETSAGLVSLNFGSNQGLGGTNPPISGGWTVPLLNATVEADGKVIVKDGKLQ